MRTAVLSALVLFAVTATGVRGQVWTDWLTEAATTVTGEMTFSSYVVDVTYTGGHHGPRTYTSDPGEAWDWDYAIYEVGGERPLPGDQIGFDAAATNTIEFSSPVVNPFMAIMSQGRTSLPVTYTFAQPFTVISEGAGYWGDGTYGTDAACGPNGACGIASTVLTGYEFHGMIQFAGTYSELNWTSTGEYWHSVTVGAVEVVPEPMSLILLGTGLLGVGVVARRRRRDEVA